MRELLQGQPVQAFSCCRRRGSPVRTGGRDRFAKGTAQLNTAAMSFLNLDWANRSATILVCEHCGMVQWFLKAPEQVEEGT